jgi:hypothetical protein
MSLVQTINLAKRGQLSKSEIYSRMLEASKVFQTVGVSEAGAFAQFCKTAEGIELLAIEKSLPGPDAASWQAPVVRKEGEDSPWNNLVKAVSKSQNISYSRAVDAALSTPEGRAVFSEQKRHELINKSGCSVADIECFDRIEKARGNDAPASPYPSEYEQAVANTLRNNPTLSQSQAHDHVRTSRPDLWNAYSKLGGNRLAHGHQTSGIAPPEATSQRSPTPRDPMWQSDHSGNRPGTTPARQPLRPDNSPTIKGGFWERQSPIAKSDYVRMLSRLAKMSPATAESVLKGL